MLDDSKGQKMKKYCAGFTLIELSVVLIIGGVLLVGALQAYQVYSERQYVDNTK